MFSFLPREIKSVRWRLYLIPSYHVGGSAGVFSWRLCWGSYRPVLIRSGVDPSFLFSCLLGVYLLYRFIILCMLCIAFYVAYLLLSYILYLDRCCAGLSLDLGGCYLR